MHEKPPWEPFDPPSRQIQTTSQRAWARQLRLALSRIAIRKREWDESRVPSGYCTENCSPTGTLAFFSATLKLFCNHPPPPRSLSSSHQILMFTFLHSGCLSSRCPLGCFGEGSRSATACLRGRLAPVGQRRRLQGGSGILGRFDALCCSCGRVCLGCIEP